jgi:hypothetical protein
MRVRLAAEPPLIEKVAAGRSRKTLAASPFGWRDGCLRRRATAETAYYVFSKRTIKPKMLLVISYLNEFSRTRYGDDLYIDKAFVALGSVSFGFLPGLRGMGHFIRISP